mmetsp:Transcript_57840/g.139710  ORF Transcript_57840/g.139710 Transcript_57840/m.139710 type:complete len:301 (+) Transcript_57840:216-1118(+)
MLEKPSIDPEQQSPHDWKHEPSPPQMPLLQPPTSEEHASPISHWAHAPQKSLHPAKMLEPATLQAPHTSPHPSPQLPKQRSNAPSLPSHSDPHASPQQPKSTSPKSPGAMPPIASMMPDPADSAESPKATAAAAVAPSSTMPAPAAMAPFEMPPFFLGAPPFLPASPSSSAFFRSASVVSYSTMLVYGHGILASTDAVTMVAFISGSFWPSSQSFAMSKSSRCLTKILSTGMCVASSVSTSIEKVPPLGVRARIWMPRGKTPLYRPDTTTGDPQNRSGIGNGYNSASFTAIINVTSVSTG